ARHLSAERFAGYLADPRHVVLVAEEDGQLVGYTMVVAGEPDDREVAAAITVRPTAELSKCYVHPDHFGSGLAATLVDRTVEVAGRLGAAALCLGVNAQNARANRFYEKRGFVVVGTRRYLVGGQVEDDLVRERVL
ncbi:MAG TPA: GNAT family N-acetyltransferase, partial [Pilimelia sp.]|nr:GNAT family N-acetyltransferase [Pilimelia sp.]